jgi:ABC-type lipoprotein export system ATPase subunit
MLPDRPPQVTFTCDIPSSTCGFQFWIGQVESFYCGLSNCTASLDIGYSSNYTEYNCEKMECACIPGKMLCGEDGSVGMSPSQSSRMRTDGTGLADITDFLTEEIHGPAKFSTRSGEDSKFEEPAMNQLINDIFGDEYITLKCTSGECMHASEVPGFVVSCIYPCREFELTMRACSDLLSRTTRFGSSQVSSSSSLRFSLDSSVSPTSLHRRSASDHVRSPVFWYLGRSSTGLDYSFLGGRIHLPSNGDVSKSLLEDHIPAALQFQDLSYILPSGRLVLDSITGSVQPGEIMAVIGASGAGKSTFLDLLARKTKQGTVTGDILVNGKKVDDVEYRRVVGFVDQEDTLMGTLTVYETVLYSALLRLPREMPLSEKKMRVLETMHELGILGIKDSRVGESGQRSISGGEKRRVSIACELVTSPSILFLDEPTSGE